MEYPKRKHPRLKTYDYSQNGSYHIIIHTDKHLSPLSEIRVKGPTDMLEAYIVLNSEGKILDIVLHDTLTHFPGYSIEAYVIMPTHIHILLYLEDALAPITDFVRVFKSIGTRECNRSDNTPGRHIFQSSFYEHIIRGQDDFLQTVQYINDNPLKEFLRNS